MNKIIPFFVTCFLVLVATPTLSSSQTNNKSIIDHLIIEPKKIYSSPPRIKDFLYWFGHPNSGEVIYLGKITRGISFETEVHLRFKNNRISSILLILGPSGINEENCVKKYTDIVNLLDEKYGPHKIKRITKDKIAEDLVYSQPCTPIRLNLYSVATIWKKEKLKILSKLLGDVDGFYIEIEYIMDHHRDKKSILKLL